MSGGVAKRAEAPQVLQHVAPATLTLENMIDLGRERLALDAEEAVASERLEPEPTPSTGRASALRMVRARLGVGHDGTRQTVGVATWEVSPGRWS